MAEGLQLGFERRLPEYSYLDSRGMGAFEGTPLAAAESQMADIDARGGDEPPPPTEDGTPNEVGCAVACVILRQLLALLRRGGHHLPFFVLV